MVSGDICAQPLPHPVLKPAEVEELDDRRSNGLWDFGVTPVDCDDDDFDDVSAVSASIAEAAAPRANNMAEPQQRR